MRQRFLALTACALLATAACGTNETPTLEGTPGADESPAGINEDDDDLQSGETGVSITEPADGSTVEAGDVRVSVTPEDFEIVNKLGQAPVDGEGHIHYYIDVDEIPTTPGKPAVTTDASTYHVAATTTHTWPNVEAGEHTLAVQLVNNDHTPLEPPVTAEVTVTVE